MTRTHATPATAPTAGRHPRSAALAPSLPLSLPLRLAISLLAITLLTTGMLVANRAHAADAAQDLVKQGAALYAQNCQYCHQADAIGKPGFAPSLTNPEFLETASDQFIMSTVRDGRPGTGMPPFSHLGRSGVQAIVAYLRDHTARPNRAAEIDKQPTAYGDQRLGQLWFEQICSTCHGVRGDGYAEGGTGTAIGTVGFLTKASDGFIRETVKIGRSNTRMLGFQGASGLANLTDREIDDIIVYLRSLKH